MIIVVKSGVLRYFENYRKIADTFLQIKGLIDKFAGMNGITNTSGSSNTNDVNLTMNSSGKSVSILCKRFNQSYLITLPYSSEHASMMRNKSMYLIKHDKKDNIVEYDVTVPPGVCYTFSADDLDGKTLIIKSNINNQVLATFTKYQIPTFNALKEKL